VRILMPYFTVVALKMWAHRPVPKSPKLLIFGINLPIRGISPWALKQFLQNLVWEREF